MTHEENWHQNFELLKAYIEFVVAFGRMETGEDNGEDKPLNVNEDGLGDGIDGDRDDGPG